MKRLILLACGALVLLSPVDTLAQNRYDEWFERGGRKHIPPREHSEGYYEREYERNRPRNRPTNNDFYTHPRNRPSAHCRHSPYTGNVECR